MRKSAIRLPLQRIFSQKESDSSRVQKHPNYASKTATGVCHATGITKDCIRDVCSQLHACRIREWSGGFFPKCRSSRYFDLGAFHYNAIKFKPIRFNSPGFTSTIDAI
jgi:hypothetical protein